MWTRARRAARRVSLCVAIILAAGILDRAHAVAPSPTSPLPPPQRAWAHYPARRTRSANSGKVFARGGCAHRPSGEDADKHASTNARAQTRELHSTLHKHTHTHDVAIVRVI